MRGLTASALNLVLGELIHKDAKQTIVVSPLLLPNLLEINNVQVL